MFMNIIPPEIEKSKRNLSRFDKCKKISKKIPKNA